MFGGCSPCRFLRDSLSCRLVLNGSGLRGRVGLDGVMYEALCVVFLEISII